MKIQPLAVRRGVLAVAVAAAVFVAGVSALTGCSRNVQGVAVAGDNGPHDVWELADDLVSRSPVSADVLSEILGIKLTVAGRGAYAGGPADLGPDLTVTSVRLLDIPAMAAVLVAVQTPDCVRLADIQAHYPGVSKRVSIVQAGRMTEQWVADYPWGALGFAIAQPPGCLQTIDISYPKLRR